MKKFLAKMHQTPHKISCVIAGGGSEAGSEILRIGGASGTILSFHMPYDCGFTDNYLQEKPEEGYASAGTANKLASKAYRDALEWKKKNNSPDPVIGMGCTSSLAKIGTERTGRQHKIFIACQSEKQAISYSIMFPESFGREIEEKINAVMIIAAMGEACEIVNWKSHETFREIVRSLNFTECALMDSVVAQNRSLDIPIHRTVVVPDAEVIDVLHDRLKSSEKIEEKPLILSTSMNPLHRDHVKLASIASELTGKSCVFELSLTNADKPPLSYFDVLNRTQPFRMEGDLRHVLTNAPTFIEKARIFGQGTTFVIGIDTAKRICDPKYYTQLKSVFAEFDRLGIKFICFAREIDGKVEEFNPDGFPPGFSSLVTVVGKDVYCSSMSSTAIRKAQCLTKKA